MKKGTIIFVMALVLILSGLLSADIYSPIAHWELDETSGTTAYDSAGANNGIVTGATWTTGKIGGCLKFDGNNDYVEVPDNDNSLDITSQMTIAMWIKVDGSSSFYSLLNKQPSGTASTNYAGNYEFRIYRHYSDKPDYFPQLLHQTGAGNSYTSYATLSSSFAPQTWHHLIVTIIAEDSVNFYIDGLPTGSLPQTASFGFLNDEPVRIGIRKDGAYDFNGALDDVRIYDYALSANEVYQLYQIPEPATIAFLGIGTLSLLRRKSNNK